MPPRRSHAVFALLVVALATGVAGATAGAAAALPRLGRCPVPQPGFGCGTLSAPLDHFAPAGQGERLRLRFAARRRAPAGAGLLIALSGGPGQSSVDAASVFESSLRPALRRYRLVVLDQRGTGRSGALNCPSVQGLRALDSFRP
ncbi:MAG TPA: hypothetical protein VGP78_03280, partial [Solirubrobacteraceae bacterium]|nr:hypothetical protein [Solirubrobacteraceae bacterium]